MHRSGGAGLQAGYEQLQHNEIKIKNNSLHVLVSDVQQRCAKNEIGSPHFDPAASTTVDA